MGTIQTARQVLVDAETRLRQMMEGALREQRYDHVAEIAGLAQGVSRVLQSQVTRDSRELSTLTEPHGLRASVAPLSTKRPTRAKSRTVSYPKFERDGDRLVKIGWSKKNKSSYEHRATKDGVYALVRHLVGSVTAGELFLVEDLLPIPDGGDGGELPAYQVYLILAWLRLSGAVEKKGRDGYVFRRGDLDDDTLEELWAKLPIQKVHKGDL